MQENRFEKKVQQQMEELRFSPSANVWKSVEEELDKRRRKRRVLYISIAAVLLIAAGLGGYALYSHTPEQVAGTERRKNVVDNTNTVSTNENKNNSSVPTENNLAAKTTGHDQIKADTGNESDLIPGTEDITSRKSAAAKKQESQAVDHSFSQKEKNGKAQQAIASPLKKKNNTKPAPQLPITESNTAGNTGELSKAGKKHAVQDNEIKQTAAGDVPPGMKDTVALALNEPSVPAAIDALALHEVMQKDSVSSGSAADSMIAAHELELPAATYQPRKKLRIGIEVSAGISNVSRDPLGLNLAAEKSADQFGTPGYTNSAFVYPASPVQTGAAFNAGISVAWPLTKRSMLLSGLHYQYRSTQTYVGYFLDRMVTVNNGQSFNNVSGYYRARQLSPYTNRYHFAEIPLTYQWQMNKGRKLPLTLDIGVAANFLVATNAVRYDTTQGGIYYKEEEGFNKMNWSAHTGLMISLKRKGQIKWSAGPVLSFQLKPVSKEQLYRKEYLYYGGMRIRMFL